MATKKAKRKKGTKNRKGIKKGTPLKPIAPLTIKLKEVYID